MKYRIYIKDTSWRLLAVVTEEVFKERYPYLVNNKNVRWEEVEE
jgi:hypothetical protein